MTSDITLVLRTCAADLTSHGGFQWPASGPVTAPDWDPAPNCGGGLHGLAWGEGDGHLLDWSDNARWLVVSVPTDTLVDLGGKVKFPAGEVVHCGDQQSATAYLAANGFHGRAIVGSTLTGGDRSTLTGGDRSNLTGGYGSNLTGGDRSTLTGGDGSTLTGGDRSTLTGGDWSNLTGGDWSTLTAGDWSTLMGWWLDGDRWRIAVGYVGEGIKADTPYRVEGGRFVEVMTR